MNTLEDSGELQRKALNTSETFNFMAFPVIFIYVSTSRKRADYHPRQNVYQINSQNNFSGHVTHYMTRNVQIMVQIMYFSCAGLVLAKKVHGVKHLRIFLRSCNAWHDLK